MMKRNRQNLDWGSSGKCFEGERMFQPRKEAQGGGGKGKLLKAECLSFM